MKKRTPNALTPELVRRYTAHLREQEKAAATIQKYIRSLAALHAFLPDGALSKTALIRWKEYLTGRYAPSSVNGMLAAVNGFLDFMGWEGMKVKPLRIQRDLFCNADRQLTRGEYMRLVHAAEDQGNRRLSLVLQTICSTGIRVSELRFITVESLKSGKAKVDNKGKRRTVYLPGELSRILSQYARERNRTAGPVFVTRTGRPLDRTNIWRDMKELCVSAGVEPGKVFPHNLRHLFARVYYTLEKDLSRLADLMGHANVNTTRIYTRESGDFHARQLGKLGLLMTE